MIVSELRCFYIKSGGNTSTSSWARCFFTFKEVISWFEVQINRQYLSIKQKTEVTMTTKKISLYAILLSIGLTLHLIPSFSLFGMKMDFLLAMMFIALKFSDERIEILSIALVFGIASAMTTSMPGGQIPNIIDKLITAFTFYYLTQFVNPKKNRIIQLFITFISTLLSGSVFILSAILITGLTLDFNYLFIFVVIPTAFGNTLIVQLLVEAMEKIKFTKLRSVYK